VKERSAEGARVDEECVGVETVATDGGVSKLDGSAEADAFGDFVVLGEVDPVDPGREIPGEAEGRVELARVQREAVPLPARVSTKSPSSSNQRSRSGGGSATGSSTNPASMEKCSLNPIESAGSTLRYWSRAVESRSLSDRSSIRISPRRLGKVGPSSAAESTSARAGEKPAIAPRMASEMTRWRLRIRRTRASLLRLANAGGIPK
jgi:hypothetical protein